MMRSAKNREPMDIRYLYPSIVYTVGCWYEVTYASNDGYHWVSKIRIIDKRFLLAKEAPSDAQSSPIVASV